MEATQILQFAPISDNEILNTIIATNSLETTLFLNNEEVNMDLN